MIDPNDGGRRRRAGQLAGDRRRHEQVPKSTCSTDALPQPHTLCGGGAQLPPSAAWPDAIGSPSIQAHSHRAQPGCRQRRDRRIAAGDTPRAPLSDKGVPVPHRGRHALVAFHNIHVTCGPSGCLCRVRPAGSGWARGVTSNTTVLDRRQSRVQVSPGPPLPTWCAMLSDTGQGQPQHEAHHGPRPASAGRSNSERLDAAYMPTKLR